MKKTDLRRLPASTLSCSDDKRELGALDTSRFNYTLMVR